MLPEERYTRNSASIIRMEYGDSFDARVAAHINNTSLGGRFDINEIALQALKISESRNYYPMGSSLPTAPDRTELISTMLNEQQAGQQIVAYVFNRQSDGNMNLDRVFERGEYSAHDVDMRLSGTLKVETVRDAGSQLIGRSYLMVYDVTNLRQALRSTAKAFFTVAGFNSSSRSEPRKFEMESGLIDRARFGMRRLPSRGACRSAYRRDRDRMCGE